MQANNTPIMWSNINENSINEFQMPGYIARTFPTLYPTGDVDLWSKHIKKSSPLSIFHIC